jgi:hypothetical protein
MSMNMVVEFHTLYYELEGILGCIGLGYKTGLKFLGYTSFKGSLFCLRVIFHVCHKAEYFGIINAEFAVPLSESIQFGRGQSDFLWISEGRFQNVDHGFYIIQPDFVCFDVWLNSVLGIALQITINVVQFMFIIVKMTVFARTFRANLGNKIRKFLPIPCISGGVRLFDSMEGQGIDCQLL